MTIPEFFKENPAVAVAFSGGVDSAWLLHEAVRWAERTAAYFVRTPFQPDFELDDAREAAARLGARLTVVELDVRKKYNVNILGVKSGDVVVPLVDPNYRFRSDAHIIVAGDKEAGIRLMNLQ